jgi:imidazolonepropionase
MTCDLLLEGAAQLVYFENDEFRIVPEADVACADGRIVWFGSSARRPSDLHTENARRLDVRGQTILPGLIDSHTHTLFAGSRADEFELKVQGVSYREIAERGGGICRTMEATRKASEEELLELGRRRIRTALTMGITTLEIKSGYGLAVDEEMKMLRVIARLADESPMTIVPTFLGAHTIPPEFSSDRAGYIDLVCDRMIPEVAEHRLAEFCDVFCDAAAFTVDETRRIFRQARECGLKLKLHADQLSHTGGAELCAEMGAASADHLENVSERGVEQLARAGVVATLLPGCSYFLNMEYAPARRLIDAGVRVALATDFNPGSCMTQNLPLIMSMGCTQMRLTPPEAIRAVTRNAARALDRADVGNISPGLSADLAVFDVPDYRHLVYHFGHNHLAHVIRRGAIVV